VAAQTGLLVLATVPLVPIPRKSALLSVE
jgi:hypothetical protein